MNKKYIISIIIVVICIFTIGAIIKINKKTAQEIQDYTIYDESEVYYTSFYSIFSSLDSDYEIKDTDVQNTMEFTYIDEDLNPIKEAKAELYDNEGYFIMDLKANNQGKIALQGLENDTTYYIKQTDTKEGLAINETLYEVKIEYTSSSKKMIIVNSTTNLSEEDQEPIRAKYEENNKKGNEEITYEVLSEEEQEETKAVNAMKYTYILLKDDLKYLKLQINKLEKQLDVEENSKADGYAVRVQNAYIMEYEIDTDNKDITLYNSKKEKTNKFYNGEEFYIKVNDGYTDFANLKFIITLKYNDVTYKISKKVNIGPYGQGKGRIKALFYDKETKEPVKGERVKLDRIVNGMEEKTTYITVEVQENGEFNFYSVPEGKYVFTKKIDGKEVSSEIFTVKSGEEIYVEF